MAERIMDIRATKKLKEYYEKFVTQSFLEDDVTFFLILIREYLPKPFGKVREICDFIAHRERDKGDTHRFAIDYYNDMKHKTSVRKVNTAGEN